MIGGLADAVRRSSAVKVYICNVMTQPGETDGYTAEDHLAAIIEHAGPLIDLMIVNGRNPSEKTIAAYAEQHQAPVHFDVSAIRGLGVSPFFGDIISEGNYLRHDSSALAETVFRLCDDFKVRKRLSAVRG